MSNIKDILVLNEKAIAVKVRKEPWKDCFIDSSSISFMYNWGGYVRGGDDYMDADFDVVSLPPGSWSILGMSDDIGVEDILKIIHPAKKLFGGYFYDYVKKAHVSVTPKNSFASLLKSKGIEVPHLILINNG